jgi:hypothetical protein
MATEPDRFDAVPLSNSVNRATGRVNVPVRVLLADGVMVNEPTAFVPVKLVSGRLPVNVALPVKTFGIVAVPLAVTAVLLRVAVALTVSVVLIVAACVTVPSDSAKAQNPIIAFIRLVSSIDIRRKLTRIGGDLLY